MPNAGNEGSDVGIRFNVKGQNENGTSIIGRAHYLARHRGNVDIKTL